MTRIIDAIKEATDILRDKPLLRRVYGDAIVSGDIHGDIKGLERVFKTREKRATDNLIMLGDYVDRGNEQIEVVEELAKAIIDEPNITILRGNHEDLTVCGRYGFLNELYKRNLDPKVFGEFFSHLPFAAISKNAFFCHGGIPINENFVAEQVLGLPRKNIVDRDTFQSQLLWNDPIYDDPIKEEEKHLPSPRGPNVYQFGMPLTLQFLERHDISMIIRAHIALLNGHGWMQNGKILSLFTSQGGPYQPYKRKVAYLDLNDKNLTSEKVEIIDLTGNN